MWGTGNDGNLHGGIDEDLSKGSETSQPNCGSNIPTIHINILYYSV
jgi:hypothetical protein